MTVARVFVDHCISRYGALKTLTTDQGNQLESQLFKALLGLIGCHRIHTTASHPSINGKIGRWHRNLKAAIMCHSNINLTRTLSTVMLGLRFKVLDTGAFPAEYVFGMTIQIPSKIILLEDFTPIPQLFLEEFREHVREIKPVLVSHKHKKKIFLYKDLGSCTHAFMRVGPLYKSLKHPCTYLHGTINFTLDSVFEINVNGILRQVSIEHPKTAFFA